MKIKILRTDYVNIRLTSRNEMIRQGARFLILGLLALTIVHFTSPEDVKAGLRHARYGLSFNMYVFLSILLLCIVPPLVFWTRILMWISVSPEENALTVEYIDRFKFKTKTVTVRLSETQIQTEMKEKGKDWQGRETPESFSLYLIHAQFGTLMVSAIEFDNIKDLVQFFENVRITAAKGLRRKRLLRKTK